MPTVQTGHESLGTLLRPRNLLDMVSFILGSLDGDLDSGDILWDFDVANICPIRLTIDV